MNREMTKEEIEEWMLQTNRTRLSLADELGVSKGTLDNWFSTKGFPLWAQKFIGLLINPKQDQSAGLEVSFTHREWMEIEQAMQITGFKIHSDFYHEVLTEGAKDIIKKEAAKNDSSLPLIADESPPYKTKRKSA